jgi:predicted membrane metal-binding protein
MIAVVLTIVSIYIDFKVEQFSSELSDISLSQFLRMSRTVIITFVVLIISKFQRKSAQMSLLVFSFIVASIADTFLILFEKVGIGILFFGVMQILLIVRHLPPIHSFDVLKPKLQLPFITTIGFYVFFCITSSSFLRTHTLQIPIYLYGLLLILSILSGFLSKYNNTFSSEQSKLIFRGMILFLLCDITVLLPMIFPLEDFAQNARDLTGLFYTPSLLFLAWSGDNTTRP